MDNGDPSGLLAALSEDIDLTEYEIETYITVLQHGELTATQIAERTSVPQPRVYDTVRALHDRGLVDMQESRPMRVLAIEPEKAFSEIQSQLDTLLTELEAIYQEPNRGVQASTLVQSRSTILRYLYNVINTAEYELIASLPVSVFESVSEQLSDLYDAGVRIDLVLSPAAEVPSASSFDYSNVAHSVRRREGMSTPTIVSADGSFSLYTTHEAVTGSANDEDLYGVIFNRSRLGFLATGFLDTVIWATAETVFENENTLPFPRRYATIRRAVNDLRRLSGEFDARVEGRDVQTGEYREFEGRVTGVEADPNRVTAYLLVETDDGEVSVGGQMATYEDIEATEIEISRA
ncbi:MAG: TrmB family transcriptional regulator [Halodesulfurarchaeum sp.]